jgi:hypothetical protein
MTEALPGDIKLTSMAPELYEIYQKYRELILELSAVPEYSDEWQLMHKAQRLLKETDTDDDSLRVTLQKLKEDNEKAWEENSKMRELLDRLVKCAVYGYDQSCTIQEFISNAQSVALDSRIFLRKLDGGEG